MLKQVLAVVLGVSVLGMTGCGELARLRRENAGLSEQLQNSQDERDAHLNIIDALEANQEELQVKLTDAQSESSRMAGLVDQFKQQQSQLDQQREELQKLVEDLIGWCVEPGPEGNFIVVENEILFAPGKIELKEDAIASLDKVTEYLVSKPDLTVRVDGHTDGVPITHSAWKDNYHLSAMRAHAVMQYLVQKGLEAERVYVVGFGPNVPRVQPEDPAEPMAANRRVEILLVPEGAKSIGEILEGFED